MKKSTTLSLIMTFALLVLSGCNEKKSEPAAEVPVQSVTLSISSYAFSDLGEALQLEATVLPANATNPKVTWTSSKTDVATVSATGLVTSVGNGHTTIIATADGKIATCDIIVDKGFITDICKNRYPCVKIGNQVWMAENMRCEKYDTQSERKGADITKYSYLEPKSVTNKPYCVDASDRNNWFDENYVTEELLQQRDKLGYMYSWAAGVGVENVAEVEPFSGNRQGICPNGWHVPTRKEYETLIDNCGGSYEADKLKSKVGWYNDWNGTDNFSFACLPAGFGEGSQVSKVGSQAYFWTASTPTGGPGANTDAIYVFLNYNSPLISINENLRSFALSVRCVKD
ncbi:MAG: Ig-like domain-containing protein [Paludibacteraceae bacterium]|nr:Ig-like domain-containing protein [Paludibacteraceae bacterium]